MATNIPPHNLKEVCNALVALLDDRELPLEKLLKHIHGPDFPTGGVILNSADEIRQIYATGQGSIKLRGTYEPAPRAAQRRADHLDPLRNRERRPGRADRRADRQGAGSAA